MYNLGYDALNCEYFYDTCIKEILRHIFNAEQCVSIYVHSEKYIIDILFSSLERKAILRKEPQGCKATKAGGVFPRMILNVPFNYPCSKFERTFAMTRELT